MRSGEGAFERTLESRLVYEGRLFSVKADMVEISWGKRTLREIVIHPGAVVIVPMLDEETVILVKQYRYAASKMLLELPAGTLEKGEGPDGCAARELEEETGFMAGSMKRLGALYLAPGYSTEVAYFYLATDLVMRDQKLEPDEKIRVIPLKLSKVLEMIRSGEIEDAKTVAGILMLMLERRMIG